MLTKRQLDKYADVLLWGLKTARKNRFNKGEIVLVRFDMEAVKLAEIIQGKLLDMGMHPILRQGLTPVMEHNCYGKSNSRQLVFIAPGQKK
ncbi:MAG: aminopeptidase, partial [Deltaproteobacteria bacterium]|nr:aminopeptidase [Deltaproteobacteria bacterium]